MGIEYLIENNKKIQEQNEEDKKYSQWYSMLVKIQPEKTISLNDMGFSQIYSQLFKDELLFNTTANQWMFFDGTRWSVDEGSVIANTRARKMSELLMLYGSKAIEDDKHREAFCKVSARYGGLNARKTMIEDAKSLMAVRQSDFDSNDNLLNLQDCTLELDSLNIHKHCAEDMLTKIAGCEYAYYTESTAWTDFVNQIMQGDEAKISYLQKIAGLSLTADTSLEACFFLYGSTTRNGKSTFVETLSAMLGDYATTIQPETLAQSKRIGATANPEIAKLQGIRFLNCSEPPKKMLLDVALLKQLTGGDAISTRQLYQNSFTFKPKFKLMINTNSLPTVTDNTLFSSNRVRIIDFNRHFEPHEQNKHLKQELTTKENLSALLLWCIEGLRMYRNEGEQPPKAVISATSKYESDSDKLKLFFNECLEQSEKNVSVKDLYSCYARWCADSGFGTDSKSTFMQMLREKNLISDRGVVNGKWVFNVVQGCSIKPIWES